MNTLILVAITIALNGDTERYVIDAGPLTVADCAAELRSGMALPPEVPADITGVALLCETEDPND